MVPRLLALALLLLPGGRAALNRAEPPSAETIVIPAERFRTDGSEGAPGGAGDALASERRFNFEGFRSQILGLWFKRKIFLQKDLVDAAEEQTSAMLQLCNEIGVTRLDDVAAALVIEGRGFAEEGNFEKARSSFKDALTFSADLPDAHFGLARANWGSGQGVGAWLREESAGVRAALRSHSLSSALFGNALIIALLALSATAILFSIAMIVRYQVLVRHDLEELLMARYPDRISAEALLVLGWALVLLPVLTWIAALWTPAYWLALTARYQKAQERVISASLLVLLILSAPAARAAEILFGLAADPGARLMLASTSGSYDPEQIVSLEQRAIADPEDPAYPFLLGGLYAKGHYYQEALAQYQKVIDLNPESYRAWNNLGNIFLRTGRAEEALKHYKNALSQRSDFLPAIYNSYLARKELLQLKEAEQAMSLAQSIDAQALAAMIEDAHQRGLGEPVDAVITREEVFRRILGDRGTGPRLASSLLSVPSILATLFLLGAVGLVVSFGAFRAVRCVRCGAAFCQRCKVGERVHDYCSQCQHLSLAREAVSLSIRRDKNDQTERFRDAQVRLSRLTSRVIPGMGRLLDGRPLGGALICSLWCAAILAIVLRPYLLRPPGTGLSRPLLLVTVLLILFAAGAWLLGNFRAARQADAPAGAWQWR